MKFLSKFKSITTFKKKDIFESISGYSDEKWLLTQMLNSEKPIHILLVGSPGIGKTRFLKAIEAAYKDLSYFALASGSTSAGIINNCFQNQPRFLLIDEIESMKQSDQITLLSLMEDGCLVETKLSRTRRLDFTCSVVATCNSITKLKEPLLSRFAVIEMRGYNTFEEFRKVALDVLKGHPLAEYIVEQVYNSSKNPNIRECVRMASLAQTEQDVHRYLIITRGDK